MSRQRDRHLRRQPTEEAIRIAVSDLLAGAGTVNVQRMSYDWRTDDVLVQIDLALPLSGSTLQAFRHELARRLHGVVPIDDPLRDWLIVIEHRGEVLTRVRPIETLDERSYD